MFLVRDVFKAKPGQATALIQKFEKVLPQIRGQGLRSQRVLVDTVAGFWTVVLETEAEDLDSYFGMADDPAAREGMEGYMDHVLSGHREIFRIAVES
jgi:hypothetical protein